MHGLEFIAKTLDDTYSFVLQQEQTKETAEMLVNLFKAKILAEYYNAEPDESTFHDRVVIDIPYCRRSWELEAESLNPYQLAVSALEAINNPVAHIKSNLKEGEILNRMAVVTITEKPAFYQNIAKDALDKIANCT